MRSANEIRSEALTTLRTMRERPYMFGSGRGFESAIRHQLMHLVFIDERDGSFGAEQDRLIESGAFSEQGVAARLASLLRTPVDDTTDAVASVYAEVATRLGYFELTRVLTETEWRELLAIDWAGIPRPTADHVIERAGSPSSGSSTRVFSYAGPEGEWLHFDFEPANERVDLRFIRSSRGGRHRVIFDLLAGARQDTAENAYRQFMLATLTGDRAKIEPLLAERHDASLLWTGAYPADVAATLARIWATDPVFDAPSEDRARVRMLQSTDGIALRLIQERDGWKVDPEPLLKLWAENEQMQ